MGKVVKTKWEKDFRKGMSKVACKRPVCANTLFSSICESQIRKDLLEERPFYADYVWENPYENLDIRKGVLKPLF